MAEIPRFSEIIYDRISGLLFWKHNPFKNLIFIFLQIQGRYNTLIVLLNQCMCSLYKILLKSLNVSRNRGCTVSDVESTMLKMWESFRTFHPLKNTEFLTWTKCPLFWKLFHLVQEAFTYCLSKQLFLPWVPFFCGSKAKFLLVFHCATSNVAYEK